MAPRSAFALAAAAAALGVAHGLTSQPAAGVPCASLDPSNPMYPTCTGSWTPTDYFTQMRQRTLNLVQLGSDTNGAFCLQQRPAWRPPAAVLTACCAGGCDFIEDAFEETFTSPVMNFTRWLPDELDGQEHCVGLPPSGPGTCTMMMTQQVQLNSPMPGGGRGATLTLSQSPCYNAANPQQPLAACCSKTGTCAYWAGAHLVSAGCIQWGVLEIEAAFSMPNVGGGFYFTALYVVYGGQDGAWNEIDVGMINNPPDATGDLEFHATVFTAHKNTPTLTTMDALNFARSPIGTSINPTTSIRNVNGVPAPQVFYNGSYASSFHTYKVVWTKTTVAWLVDTTVYRNISYAPWRPMSIRQILRTNKGNQAIGPAFPDSNVYIRRIRYTPLSAQAVADAYRCTSMFACYGAMPAAPTGSASSFVSMATSLPASLGHRHLLQAVTNSADDLALAVASLVPGMPAQNVTTMPSAYSLTFVLAISNLNTYQGASPLDIWNGQGLQPNFVAGLADDVIPGPDNILVTDVSLDSTNSILLVSVTVSGYTDISQLSGPNGDYTMLQDATELDGTAASLNNALGLASSYITSGASIVSTDPNYVPQPVGVPSSNSSILSNQALCPSYPDAYDSTCRDANNNTAAVFCPYCVLFNISGLSVITTYSVTVPAAASAVSNLEAIMGSAINSGVLSDALNNVPATSGRRHLLQAGGNSSLVPTDNLLVQRILASDASAALASYAATCSAAVDTKAKWEAAAIAFIVAFGCLVLALIAFNAGKRSERALLAAMVMAEPKLMTTDTLHL